MRRRMSTTARRVSGCRQRSAAAADVVEAFELGMAAERDRWRRQIDMILDAADRGTLEQLLDEL